MNDLLGVRGADTNGIPHDSIETHRPRDIHADTVCFDHIGIREIRSTDVPVTGYTRGIAVYMLSDKVCSAELNANGVGKDLVCADSHVSERIRAGHIRGDPRGIVTNSVRYQWSRRTVDHACTAPGSRREPSPVPRANSP